MPATILPNQNCDLVMKGGVTSGVIYPLAVTELADTYCFQNIGGTSAGAIAAALAAAAEFRRRSGSMSGFETLKALPRELGAEGFLVSLFAPDPSMRGLFRACFSLTTKSHIAVKALRLWLAILVGFFWSAAIGALVGGAIPAILWRSGYVSGRVAIALGALWVLTGATLGAVMTAVRTVPRLLRENRFGLSTGFRPGGAAGKPPLVNWLYGYLNDLAGLPLTTPLTFRHLHDAPPANGAANGERSINLEVLTTNLTFGQPHRLPFPKNESTRFYFSPREWQSYFPEAVITHLENAARNLGGRIPKTAEGLDLFPVPSDDLPVIVAVRMSLSFPVLFSAVPLWAVDYTRKMNNDLAAEDRPTAERCWFSDGGISSNFPIHFFDSPVPRWPTFGINLKSPHPDHMDENDFVWLPSSNGAGLAPRWNRFDAGSDGDQVFGYVGAVVDSLQNWRDNLAARMPGYRNRIVHVSQRHDEGGLNLAMPPDAIARLSDRGRRAGHILKTEFDFDNHVWVRYRSYMAALLESVQRLAVGYRATHSQGEHAWSLINGTSAGPFPSYAYTSDLHHEAVQLTGDTVTAAEGVDENLVRTAPRPRPELRTVPRV